MRIEQRSSADERKVLTGMILDRQVLSRIASQWKPGMFRSAWCNLVGQWCIDYLARYDAPPGKEIQSLYASWAETAHEKTTANLIGTFLESLSDEYEATGEINPNYLVDLAGRHFNTVRMEELAEGIQSDIAAGQADKATERLATWNKVELGVGAGIDVLNDMEAIREAFQTKSEPLIHFPSALGQFFGNTLERDGFIGVMGPDKRGKCIDADSLVLLADGTSMRIEDVVRKRIHKDAVSYDPVSMRFRPAPITDYFDNGEKECWKLVTKTGREAVTTSNHKYLTPNGWKELGHIKPGDFVAVPKRVAFFGDRKMQPELVRFIAYMLTDGCCVINEKSGDLACSFTKTYADTITDFKRCCDLLGVNYKPNGTSFNLSGRARRIIRHFGLAGHSARTKVIPQEIFLLPKEQLADFLRVFFTCDGYVCIDARTVGIGLSNKTMIHQLGSLLSRFGIVFKIIERDSSWVISIRDQENILLFVGSINCESYKQTKTNDWKKLKGRSFLDKFPPIVARQFYNELKEEISTTDGIKKRLGNSAGSIRYQTNKGYPIMRRCFEKAKGTKTHEKYMGSDVLWDEVISLTPVGLRRTYDITIKGLHNFVANNCLVHNTFWLSEICFRALLARRRVAYFQCGDQSQPQIMRRLMARVARQPFASDNGWPLVVKYPTSIQRAKGQWTAEVEHGFKEFTAPLSWRRAIKACEELTTKRVRSKETYWKLSCHPNSTISMNGIRSILAGWEREGWVPDVVVIDYADIMATDYPRLDIRHQINETWKQMRALSQSLHCLVVTASQTDADAYRKSIITRSNFSDDKRKLAHVTGMVGLNQTPEEKELSITRLNWVVRRDGGYSETKCVHVAGCLALANPAVVSCW